MAKKKTKIPRDVQKLQLRFQDAQASYSEEYQKAINEYQTRVGAYEKESAKFLGSVSEYERKTQAYTDYLSSFFVPQGSNSPQEFYTYGDQFYFLDQLRPGTNLRMVSSLPSLAGSEYQFVKTGEKVHSYQYWQKEWVSSGRFESRPYTEMVWKPVTEYEYVYVPPSFPSITSGPSFAPIGSTGFAPIGSTGIGSMGGYEYRPVTRNKLVPETRYRNEWVDTSSFQDVQKTSVEKLATGYLKTQLPGGGFTSLAPSQFEITTAPEEFKGTPPPAPKEIDISAAQTRLKEEEEYFKREVGERKSSAVAARRRVSVRPLLSTEGVQ
jgi:hypothetical protein